MNEKYCPIKAVTKLIGGKWKMISLFVTQLGSKRFGILKRILVTITEQMLTNQLRELEKKIFS